LALPRQRARSLGCQASALEFGLGRGGRTLLDLVALPVDGDTPTDAALPTSPTHGSAR